MFILTHSLFFFITIKFVPSAMEGSAFIALIFIYFTFYYGINDNY